MRDIRIGEIYLVWSLYWLIIIRLNRLFLKRAYPTMKKNNPFTPILMREALDVEPRVFARYGRG